MENHNEFIKQCLAERRKSQMEKERARKRQNLIRYIFLIAAIISLAIYGTITTYKTHKGLCTKCNSPLYYEGQVIDRGYTKYRYRCTNPDCNTYYDNYDQINIK